MTILFKIIEYIFITYFYASVLILPYVIYTKRDLDKYPIFGIRLFKWNFFSFGAFIGLSIFFKPGFEKALFFFQDWNQKDEWASALAIVASLISTGLLNKLYKNVQAK